MIDPSQGTLSDKNQHAQETDIRVPSGIRTHNLSKRAAADPRLRPSDPGIGESEVIVMHLMERSSNLTLLGSGHITCVKHNNCHVYSR
jgi:hypothetical protein